MFCLFSWSFSVGLMAVLLFPGNANRKRKFGPAQVCWSHRWREGFAARFNVARPPIAWRLADPAHCRQNLPSAHRRSFDRCRRFRRWACRHARVAFMSPRTRTSKASRLLTFSQKRAATASFTAKAPKKPGSSSRTETLRWSVNWKSRRPLTVVGVRPHTVRRKSPVMEGKISLKWQMWLSLNRRTPRPQVTAPKLPIFLLVRMMALLEVALTIRSPLPTPLRSATCMQQRYQQKVKCQQHRLPVTVKRISQRPPAALRHLSLLQDPASTAAREVTAAFPHTCYSMARARFSPAQLGHLPPLARAHRTQARTRLAIMSSRATHLRPSPTHPPIEIWGREAAVADFSPIFHRSQVPKTLSCSACSINTIVSCHFLKFFIKRHLVIFFLPRHYWIPSMCEREYNTTSKMGTEPYCFFFFSFSDFHRGSDQAQDDYRNAAERHQSDEADCWRESDTRTSFGEDLRRLLGAGA